MRRNTERPIKIIQNAHPHQKSDNMCVCWGGVWALVSVDRRGAARKEREGDVGAWGMAAHASFQGPQGREYHDSPRIMCGGVERVTIPKNGEPTT